MVKTASAWSEIDSFSHNTSVCDVCQTVGGQTGGRNYYDNRALHSTAL